MASRRMFAKKVINSDTFLDMPHSTQLLYFHLGMQADDDGFVDNYRSIMRNLGCNEDNLKLLVVKGFVIWLEERLVIIRHWKLHNQIQKDRYKPTQYLTEKAFLTISKNGVYNLDTKCIQNGYNLDTQYSIGKYSIVEDSIDECICANTHTQQSKAKFVPPTVEEVQAYCLERNNGIDAQRFVDFYASKGWLVGKSPMKDWRASVRFWESSKQQPTANNDQQSSWLDTLDDL